MLQLAEMSYGQYSAVYNALSFNIAAMGAATLFFWLNRASVAPVYRLALTIAGIVTATAAYHYVRIFSSWTDAFTVVGQVARPSGVQFNDGYRYVDWLLTVPLLLIELLLVMRLPADETRRRAWGLGLAAVLMIALGYPGESATSNVVRAFWGTASSIPFAYIIWQLFKGLGEVIDRQPEEVRPRIRQARLLTLATWGVYPIVYMVPYIGERTAGIEVAVQVGYTVADVLAKAGFGLLIFSIARAKSRHEPGDQVEYRVTETGS